MESETASPADACRQTSIERRMMHNGIVFTLWILLFGACFLAGHWAVARTDWVPHGAGGVAFSLIPMIPGLLAFCAYLRLLREADELVRKVFVEGTLFAFGATMLVWGAIQLPEHLWLSKIKADLMMSVMMLSWTLGTLLAARRHI
jgi:hypothetical protein